MSTTTKNVTNFLCFKCVEIVRKMMSDDGAKMDAQMSESKKKHLARYTTGLLKLSSLI